jgi:deoxyadenosine/deoxycytidine kinase
MKRFVVVSGNIGVGKSTLVHLLAERLGWDPFYEPVVENPYLADFYRDMRAWSFHSQIFFLTRRLKIHRELCDHPTSALQDRSLYEDAEVFARNLFQQGYFSERDYRSYREIYETLSTFLPPPDLVVYLRASVPTLVRRVSQRGRSYERSITHQYLGQLNDLYEGWIEGFTACPVLTVPADNLDYTHDNSHLRLIAAKVEEKLAGKEEVVFSVEELERANSEAASGWLDSDPAFR